ncbi:MAG TPA: DUF1153 domain-containing protein [Sphingobium sp.]
MHNRVSTDTAGTSGGDHPNTLWVVGPKGERLTREDLPAPGLRWTSVRKAVVVAAVGGGLISLAETLETYNLTIEEFASWQRCVDRFGMRGLRATYSQRYREKIERELRLDFGWLETPRD